MFIKVFAQFSMAYSLASFGCGQLSSKYPLSWSIQASILSSRISSDRSYFTSFSVILISDAKYSSLIILYGWTFCWRTFSLIFLRRSSRYCENSEFSLKRSLFLSCRTCLIRVISFFSKAYLNVMIDRICLSSLYTLASLVSAWLMLELQSMEARMT